MSGDIRALIGRFEALASRELMSKLTRRLANDLHAEMIAGIREQRDPYGNAWAKRKSGGDWPLLDKSGKMINRISARPTATGVRITTVDYAGYHQTGTRNMPARRIVPDPAQGLGERWGGVVERDVLDALVSALEGR